MYWRFLQLVARSRDPEDAHELALRLMKRAQRYKWLLALLRRITAVPARSMRQKLLGRVFDSPVLLACGMDKNCDITAMLEAFGFASVEGGGVTPEAYPGNPRPRIFRDPAERAIVNRMSFPGIGAAGVSRNMAGMPRAYGRPRGVNLVKAHATDPEQAGWDYVSMLRQLRWQFDYYVINVSSPNMAGLRAMADMLDLILGPVCDYARDAVISPKRLLVKISPDMTEAEREQVVAECVRFGIGGIIATNTTVDRPVTSPISAEDGGLSGRPLYTRALKAVEHLASIMPRDMVLIACGGIDSTDRAYEMLEFADLVQTLTGFIYGGPFFAARLKWGIWRRLRRDGHRHLSEHNTRKGA